MFFYRNKAQNGAQLLVVMADVYDNYLRLRLSDVILKKDTSSKTATSTIPLSAVTHDGGAVYQVTSAGQENVQYSVDLSIGTCSCSSGNTGSVCKHQLAASQFSAIRLPQLYTCTAIEKKRLYRILYGDKEMPTTSFFDGLVAHPPENEISQLDHINEEMAVCHQHQKDVAAAGTVEVAETTEVLDERIDEFTSMLNRELKRTKGTSMLSSLNIFEQRVKACKNPAQVSTFLRTAGCTLFKASGAFRKKIPCQPTSIARRLSGQPRGKAALLKGKIIKRKRNLALNISNNVPNAKIH